MGRFWKLWSLLRDWLYATKRIYLLPLLLLDVKWYEQNLDSPLLEGKRKFYEKVIIEVGIYSINASLKLLAGIGLKKFMPDSLLWAAFLLKHVDGSEVQIEIVEKLLHGSFYNYGQK